MKLAAILGAILAPLVFVGVLALRLSEPIVERWQDQNEQARALARLEVERQEIDLQNYQTRQAAALPARILGDYGLLALLGGAVLGLGWLVRDFYRQRRTPLVRYAGGLPVARHLVENADPVLLEMMAAALQLDGAAAIERARASAAVPTSYAPHVTVAQPPRERQESTVAAPAQLTDSGKTPELPGVTDLASVLESGFTPTKDRILLALGPGGAPLTAPLNKMVHVALCGATGGGKSNLLRLLMPQFLAAGARCLLVDPHYARIDPEDGSDWGPIEDRLAMRPAVKAGEIEATLKWAVAELERRLERRNRGQRIGRPVVVCYDELPILVELVEDAPALLGRILREGRKVGLLTAGASQEFLVKTIGGSSGARDQYRTAYYLGGDKLSAAALLDVPARNIDDGPLGHGLALLRSTATPAATLVRVPLVSNASLYRLLDIGQVATTDDESGYHEATVEPVDDAAAVANGKPGGSRMVASTEVGSTAAASAEAARAAAMFMEGVDPAEITREIRGVTSREGRRYQTALQETLALIREGVRGGQL